MSVNSKENGLLKNVEKKFRPKTFATFAAEHFKLGPSDKKLYLSDAVTEKITEIGTLFNANTSTKWVNDANEAPYGVCGVSAGGLNNPFAFWSTLYTTGFEAYKQQLAIGWNDDVFHFGGMAYRVYDESSHWGEWQSIFPPKSDIIFTSNETLLTTDVNNAPMGISTSNGDSLNSPFDFWATIMTCGSSNYKQQTAYGWSASDDGNTGGIKYRAYENGTWTNWERISKGTSNITRKWTAINNMISLQDLVDNYDEVMLCAQWGGVESDGNYDQRNASINIPVAYIAHRLGLGRKPRFVVGGAASFTAPYPWSASITIMYDGSMFSINKHSAYVNGNQTNDYGLIVYAR